MKTFSLSLRKCSTLSLVAIALALPSAELTAAKPSSAPQQLKTKLLKELELHRGRNFELLIRRWSKRYGTRATSPLLELAQTQSLDDSKRYIAVVAAGRIGGEEALAGIRKLTKDKSWMIRSACLNVLAALKQPRDHAALLARTKDKALVIRKQAVEILGKVRVPGAKPSLIEAVMDPRNYHRGKALWVPQKAILALTQYSLSLKDAKKLLPVLEKPSDNGIRLLTLKLLERRWGKNRPSPKGPKISTLDYWKKTLKRI
jgi:HEAT repeat protein